MYDSLENSDFRVMLGQTPEGACHRCLNSIRIDRFDGSGQEHLRSVGRLYDLYPHQLEQDGGLAIMFVLARRIGKQ
jgi:hypothetical protein